MRRSNQLLDEIRARLSVSQVVARKVQLKRAGREFKGLSPFKQEKTPSFTVNDQKGFYHCFATGEHGDIFTFLMKTEGCSFPEAVERLAEEAGVQLPREKTYNPAREDQRKRLLSLVEQAASYFVQQLNSPAGQAARDYLDRRAIGGETAQAFQLGYAGDSRTALKSHFLAAGFTEAELIQSGMIIGGDDIPSSYDRFRHRLMFPIHDAQGRVVAFGGRALDPSQPAKYLNSPETPLFHKGALLYNAHRARGPAYEVGELVVVEGYMDAIALSRAGFEHAVAPLGTALTAEQMRLMWRITPEPILCFDGDAAGQKAAHRAIDTAIPLLVPGYSLRFTFLSGGLDPDDLIRQQGPSAMRAALNSARPLADVLWDREWNSGSWTTPERRAGLEAKLRSIVTQIGDSAVRAHYGQILKERLTQAWGPERGFSAKSSRRFENRRGNTFARGSASGVTGHGRFQAERTSSLKQSALVGGAGQALPYREALLIRTLLNHPWLIDEFAEDISELQLSSPVLTRLRDGLLTLLANEISLDSATIHTQLEGLKLRQDLDLVERLATHNSDRFVEREAERAEVETGWRHILALHKRQTLQDQLSVAGREYRNDDSDDAMARIVELQRLIASPGDHETQYED